MTVPASALPPPVAILLYWDNTLCDSWAVIHPAMTATIEALGGRPWTLEETRRNVRQSARDAFPALFGAREDQATAVFYRTYEADHLDRLPPLPGAEAMLQALAGAGDLTLGVVSNKRGPLLRRSEEHTSELQSLMRSSYAVCFLQQNHTHETG